MVMLESGHRAMFKAEQLLDISRVKHIIILQFQYQLNIKSITPCPNQKNWF